MSNLQRNLVNAALFQLGWFACVFGAQRPWLLLVAASCLLAHLFWLSLGWREWRLIAGVTLFGCALDSLLLNLGLFDFPGDSPLLPLWLALLWALFASTLEHCLQWTARHVWLGMLCGAVAGPLSYYGGAQIAGVGLPLGNLTTVLLLACIWACVMAVILGLRRTGLGAFPQP